MKIIIISDTHGDLLKLPECDVTCICGDIIPLNVQNDLIKSAIWFVEKFIPWANNLKCDKVIFIAGNHDHLLDALHQRNYVPWEVEETLLLNNTKISYLCDSFIEFKGKIFYGTPWCPDLKRWAFYGTHEELVNKFNLIYPNCDILLTHCPPKIDQCGTVLQPNTFNYMTDYGCKELRDAIENLHPKWNFCGHVHSGDHEIINFNDTKIVNVSIKDENYKIAYEPLVLEI